MLRSPNRRVGPGRCGKIWSGGTDQRLFDRPFMLFELMMVNLVMEGVKKPSGVNRSRAMMSPLSNNHGSNLMVDKKELKT